LEEEHAKRGNNTNSWVGPKYVRHFIKQGLNPYDGESLPKVEVAVKIYSIRNVDMTHGTFDLDFNLMMDWLDPTLEGRTVMDDSMDWDDYFVPAVFVENALQVELVGGESKPRLRGDPNHVIHTQRMRATLRNKYQVKNFPLDTQYLTIKFKARTVSNGRKWENGLTSNTATVWLCDPYTWRGKSGHQVAEDADELPDLKIVKIDGGPVASNKKNLNHHNEYHVQICVMRESAGIVYGLGVPLFGVMLLSFGVFVVDMEELGDRLALVITNMLTLVAIKWVLEAKLPSVPYLTLADQYVLACFLLLLIQGAICIICTHVFEAGQEEMAKSLNFWSIITLFVGFVMTHAYLGFKTMGLADEGPIQRRHGIYTVSEEALQNDEITCPFLRGPKSVEQSFSRSDGKLPTSKGLPEGWSGPHYDDVKNKKTGAFERIKYYIDHRTNRTQRRPPMLNPGLVRQQSKKKNKTMLSFSPRKSSKRSKKKKERGSGSSQRATGSGNIGLESLTGDSKANDEYIRDADLYVGGKLGT